MPNKGASPLPHTTQRVHIVEGIFLPIKKGKSAPIPHKNPLGGGIFVPNKGASPQFADANEELALCSFGAKSTRLMGFYLPD